MWPFNIKQKLQTKYMISAFGKSIGENVVRGLSEEGSEFEKIRKIEIDYLFILADDSDLENLPPLLSSIFSVIQKHGGDLVNISGALIIVSWGAVYPQENMGSLRKNAIEELLALHGDSVCLLHGRSECPTGAVGNEKRKAYLSLIPNFRDKLKKITELDFGQSIEIQ